MTTFRITPSSVSAPSSLVVRLFEHYQEAADYADNIGAGKPMRRIKDGSTYWAVARIDKQALQASTGRPRIQRLPAWRKPRDTYDAWPYWIDAPGFAPAEGEAPSHV